MLAVVKSLPLLQYCEISVQYKQIFTNESLTSFLSSEATEICFGVFLRIEIVCLFVSSYHFLFRWPAYPTFLRYVKRSIQNRYPQLFEKQKLDNFSQTPSARSRYTLHIPFLAFIQSHAC